MSCCGGKRREWQAAVQAGGEVAAMRFQEEPGVLFEYTGRTGLSVRGPISGRPYRFSATGDRVEVDRRDAGSLTAIPNLKRCIR